MKRVVISDDSDSDFEVVSTRVANAIAPKRRVNGSLDGLYAQQQLAENAESTENAENADYSENVADESVDTSVNDSLDKLYAQQLVVECELAEIDKEMARLKRRRATKATRLRGIQDSIDAACRDAQAQKNERLRSGYEQSDFPWSDAIHALLHSVFKLPSFRDNQEAVINATLDNRDVVVIMPTGGGKSLCYQLPALVSSGLTLVVSPLIALMVDQVLQLKELGVNAEALTSESADAKAITDKVRQLYAPGARAAGGGGGDELRLLYVSPEKIVGGKRLLPMIEKVHAAGKLRRIVVDECHCVSEYGNDFRSDYKSLGKLKYAFGQVPLIALSATCPPRVLRSVCATLGIEGGAGRPRAIVYTSPLWRANLRYSVERKAEAPQARLQQVADWITQHHAASRGIVYCASRDSACSLAALLQANGARSYRAELYYADLDRARKEQLHRAWRAGRVQIVVATNAFGMGINAPDVRFVAHLTAPKTLENYYQESGRAGRDGQPADCVLFYRAPDASDLARWGFDGRSVEGLAKARAMVAYAECAHLCRKVVLQAYLQDASAHPAPLAQKVAALGRAQPSDADADADAPGLAVCGECDVCRLRPRAVAVDCTELLITAVNVVQAAGEEQLTLLKLVAYCRGYGLRKAPAIAALPARSCARFVPGLSPEDWGYVVSQLVASGVLAYKFGHTAHATNVYLVVSALHERPDARTLDQAGDMEPFIVCFASTALPEALSHLRRE